MKRGPLWKISVAIAPEAEEAVVALLGELFGKTPAVFADARTGRTSAAVFLDGPSPPLLLKRAALRAGLRRIRDCGLELGAGSVSVRQVRREDWAESWKRHFAPLEINRALLVRPGWSRRRAKRGQAVVVLDPGLSFGTGQHPTTRFCLEQIAAGSTRDDTRSLLDIGTGSGILAIAAAKLGFRPVQALDSDAEAVRAARRNARRNRVERKIRFTRQDLLRLPMDSRNQFDLVCANLTCDLLLSERQRIVRRLKRGGRLVLAGILTSQFATLRQHYEREGFRLVVHQTKEGWASGVFAFLKPGRAKITKDLLNFAPEG